MLQKIKEIQQVLKYFYYREEYKLRQKNKDKILMDGKHLKGLRKLDKHLWIECSPKNSNYDNQSLIFLSLSLILIILITTSLKNFRLLY